MREPPSDLRQAARACREMFDALVYEGFTEAQALRLVAGVITQHQPPKDGDT
jgi:hypothetical protein